MKRPKVKPAPAGRPSQPLRAARLAAHTVQIFLLATIVVAPAAARAQTGTLTAADSALIGKILLAEDRRDSTEAAITEGARHADARVRAMAQRARGRIRDPRFAARDSLPALPALPAPTAWPEAGWRLRLRGLAAKRSDCDAMFAALSDLSWPVRLGATDQTARADTPCAGSDSLAATYRKWIDDVPSDVSRRDAGNVSWHAAAHAIVALARLRPADARPRVAKLATHRQWQLRMYSARAAATIADTATLRMLARDRDDNVTETAIGALARLTGHADDGIYVAALAGEGAQAVRAAATALKGSPRTDVRATLNAAFDRWVARNVASARDARVALLDAAGRPASDDRPPAIRVELPPQTVALALGADVRLRVTIAQSSGGGSFIVRLRGDVAPMMAARILALARSDYYNGRTWHRVEHDFVIQGGSPGANEYVGAAQFLRDELGTVPHARGTVGMSTRGHDTGDAQWFVNLTDNLRLGRDYTVFAEVVEGIGVVDGILEGDVIASIAVVGR